MSYNYIISSERADRRNDEKDNLLISKKKYSVGDEIILDGLKWFVEKEVENNE